ncbi:MAG: tetratricopeptide repeat protein [Desulfobacterales bacterium]
MAKQKALYTDKHEWGLFINAALLAVLTITAVFLYASTLEAPFLFDDRYAIFDEKSAIQIDTLNLESLKQVVTQSHGRSRPLAMISLAINYYFHEFDVFGYHLLNIAVHVLTAFCLFFLFQTTLRLPMNAGKKVACSDGELAPSSVLEPTWIAFFAALIWMAHPVQTNAVSYIVQRMTSLAALFYILSLLLYVKGRLAVRAGRFKSAAAFFAGCLFSALGAFFSKEISATLPLFILLYEWFFFQDLRIYKIRRLLAGAFLLIASIGAVIYLFLGKNAISRIIALGSCDVFEFTLVQRVLTEFRILGHYLGLVFFPHPARLNLDYDYPVSSSVIDPATTLIAIIMVTALFIAALVLARRHRLFGFCVLWFLGTLVIESSIVCIELIYEHRLYLPSMMVILLAVCFVYRGIRHKRVAAALLLAIACAFSVWTYQRNQVWAGSDVAFWRDCAVKSPRDERPHQHIATILLRKGDYKSAVWHYRKSLVFQINTAALFRLGFCYEKLGWHAEAVEAYEKSIKYGYRDPAVFSSLGREQLMTGAYEAALKSFEKAVKIDPGFDEAKNNKEKLAAFLEKCTTPLDCTKKLCDAYPRNPSLRVRLGMLFAEQNNLEQAIANYQQAIAMIRETNRLLYPRTLLRLADAYMKTGDRSKAMPLLENAAGLKPNDPEACYLLAALYAQTGHPEKALQWLEKAVNQGFGNSGRLVSDARFDSVRGNGRFLEIKARLDAADQSPRQSS